MIVDEPTDPVYIDVCTGSSLQHQQSWNAIRNKTSASLSMYEDHRVHMYWVASHSGQYSWLH